MKTMVSLLSVCLLAFVAAAAESARAPVFQMRLVANAPSDDSEEMVPVGQTEKLYVIKAVLLDQTDLKSARVAKDPQIGRPQIEIRFTDKGRKRFEKVTDENIGKRLAVVIAGRLYSAPRIMAGISSGIGVITGNFTEQEANALADRINQSLKKN